MIDAPSRPACVAVIDDDESAREAMQGLLRSFGYAVSAFCSADEFLRATPRPEADCIVTDIQMPGRSGLDLGKLLAAEGDLTPVIFVTGLPPEDSLRRAVEAAPHSLFPKPVDTDGLVRCIEAALSGSPRD